MEAYIKCMRFKSFDNYEGSFERLETRINHFHPVAGGCFVGSGVNLHGGGVSYLISDDHANPRFITQQGPRGLRDLRFKAMVLSGEEFRSLFFMKVKLGLNSGQVCSENQF